MSYEVTATRRRPQKFSDLAGQEFVAETLKNAIQSKKIAHAYLFSGPRGCGKTSTARILAKALNCKNGPTAEPCGQCQQCLEITKGSCTDVIEIDGASNTSVNDIRQIKDEVLFPPQSCRYKIYIIDEVHMLSTSAFNALLKTIEEPPPYVIFIFATTELQKVPATIKSRCQQFNFRLVAIDRIKELLADAAKEIGIEAEDEALYWVARESGGSVRDSYTLFDQVAAFSGDKITYEKIRDKLGLVGVDRLNALFEDCAQNKAKDALEKLDSFLQAGVSIEQLIQNAADYLRSLLLIKTGITKEALLGQSVERYSKIVLQTWNSVQIERGISIFTQLYRDIRYSLNARYELELAISRMSWLNQYVSPAEVKAAIDKARTILMQGASSQTASPTSQNMQNPLPQNQAPAAAPVQNPQNSPAQSQTAPQTNAAHNSMPKAPSLPMFSALREAQGIQPQVDSSAYEEGSYAPDDSVPPEADAGSVNPFDDGGAVPPEQTAVPSNSAFNSFNANNVTVADGGDLKNQVLNELKRTDPVFYAVLVQTGNWNWQNETVTAEAQTEFAKKQIEFHRQKINGFLTKFCGRQMNFQVIVRQKVESHVQEVFPAEVQILLDTFRGEVTGHSSVPSQNQPAQNPQNQNATSQNDEENDNQESEDSSADYMPVEEDEDSDE